MSDQSIQFLENSIRQASSEIRKRAHYMFEDIYGNMASKEVVEWSKECTYEEIRKTYNLICVYLELRNFNQYLLDFKSQFQSKVQEKNKALEFISYPIAHGEDWDEDLAILLEWDIFLYPFIFYSEKKNALQNKLKNCLTETNDILKFHKAKVKNESSINKVMREFLSYFFKGVEAYSEGYFRSNDRAYHPDIIIRELLTSIEYKIVREKKDIQDKMNELIIDAKRYIDNDRNRNCIAVFCILKSVTYPSDKIYDDWHKLDFPKNWSLIIVKDIELVSATSI